MDILFKREQSSGSVGRINFKLWCQVEFNEEERALIERYDFENAILIEGDETALLKLAAYAGIGAFFISFVFLYALSTLGGALILALLIGGGVGFWLFNEKRETIMVKDVVHGRYFKCKSVIDLARKEAELGGVIATLSAVMASAKHWDGEERLHVEPLTREQAKLLLKSI